MTPIWRVCRQSSLSARAGLRRFREHHRALIITRRIVIALYEELLIDFVLLYRVLLLVVFDFRIRASGRSGSTLTTDMLRYERIVAVLCFRLASTMLL